MRRKINSGVKVTLFQAKASRMEDECRDCMDRFLPVTLLQMRGSKSDKGEYTFESAWEVLRMMKASVEQPGGDRAGTSVLNAQALMSEDNTDSFAGKTFEHKDVSFLLGRETTAMSFLSLPSHTSGITDLNKEESLWKNQLGARA